MDCGKVLSNAWFLTERDFDEYAYQALRLLESVIWQATPCSVESLLPLVYREHRGLRWRLGLRQPPLHLYFLRHPRQRQPLFLVASIRILIRSNSQRLNRGVYYPTLRTIYPLL